MKVKTVHTPVTLTEEEELRGQRKRTFIKWNEDHKLECRESLLNCAENLNRLCENLYFDSQDGLDGTVTGFCEFLNGVMAPFF